MQIKFHADHPDLAPYRAHYTDAGWDLRAAEDKLIYPYSVTKVRTGVRVAIPAGHFGLIRLRSGFAALGFSLESSGVIDADYRGEMMIPLSAISESMKVCAKERIAQLIVLPLPAVEMVGVHDPRDLGDTERGTGGFGSTGA